MFSIVCLLVVLMLLFCYSCSDPLKSCIFLILLLVLISPFLSFSGSGFFGYFCCLIFLSGIFMILIYFCCYSSWLLTTFSFLEIFISVFFFSISLFLCLQVSFQSLDSWTIYSFIYFPFLLFILVFYIVFFFFILVFINSSGALRGF